MKDLHSSFFCHFSAHDENCLRGPRATPGWRPRGPIPLTSYGERGQEKVLGFYARLKEASGICTDVKGCGWFFLQSFAS